MAERRGAARVTSIDAPARFRPALVKFIEEARSAIGSCQSDAGRALEWIRREQTPYWRREVRVRTDALTKAKSEVIRKASTPTPTGAPPSTVEERKAAAKAQRALEEAQERLENCQAQERRLQRAIEEYKGGVQELASLLAADLDEAVHTLDRMTAALEAYVTLAPPTEAQGRRTAPGEGEDGA